MIDPDPYQSVPLQLAEKADVLFGNLPEICAFHGQILLPDLESSLSSPQLVASCFLRHVRNIMFCFFLQDLHPRHLSGEFQFYRKYLTMSFFLTTDGRFAFAVQLLLSEYSSVGRASSSGGRTKQSLSSPVPNKPWTQAST